MTTDPKKSLTPTSIPELAKSDVDQLLQTGLADFSLRELLGLLISSEAPPHATSIWKIRPPINRTGFTIVPSQLGTIPVDVRVPRTRTGEFRPASLPPRYRRGYGEEVQSLLLGLLPRAARLMPPKTHSRRWDCRVLHRTWNVSQLE
jgi:hypothetical protein